MNDSLLGALLVHFSDRAENIATDSLCYLLQRSTTANKALLAFIRHYAPYLPSQLVFTTQKENPEGGISDLVGKDDELHLRLIIESKFWAGLTEKQPVAYLRSLPKAQQGVLLILGPEKRLVTLWPELKRRAVDEGLPITLLCEAAPCYVASISEHTFLMLTSWRAILDVLHTSVVAANEVRIAGDIIQLQGLAEQMDTTAFLPLHAEELAPIHGRRLLDFCSLVDEVAERLRPLPGVSFDGVRATGRLGSYGRYFTVYEFGAFLRFDAHKWVSLVETPIWLEIKGRKWQYSSDLKQRLESLEHEQPPRLFAGKENWFMIPLFLPVGQERQQVVDSLLAQVLFVTAKLAPDAPNLSL